MATKRKRVTVSFEPHHYEVLKRLATLQERPISGVISELIEVIIPPLVRTVALLDAAHNAPQEVKDGLRDSVESMERELTRSAGDSLDQLDFMEDLIRRRSEGA